MSHRWTLSIALATFIGVAALLFLVRSLQTRIVTLESRLSSGTLEETRTTSSKGSTANGGDNKTSDDADAKELDAATEPDQDIRQSKDLHAKLNWLIDQLEEMGEADYEAVTDTSDTLYKLERGQARLLTRLKRLGGSKSLPGRETKLSAKDIAAFKVAAAGYGIQVEEGVVTVRAVLNAYSLRVHGTSYPFELLGARYPSEKDYETLILVIGHREPEALQRIQYTDAKAATMAMYKGMLAAGFLQGEGTRVDPASPDPEKPNALLANGDVVYLYVRYKYEDKIYTEQVSDWLTDAVTGKTLPSDAFRFTGSQRTEDTETGDDTIVAALSGTLITQYPNPAAMIEIAIPSALKGSPGFSANHIPRPVLEDHFYVDLIMSRTPRAITPRADLPTFPPAPKAGEDNQPGDDKNKNNSEGDQGDRPSEEVEEEK